MHKRFNFSSVSEVSFTSIPLITAGTE